MASKFSPGKPTSPQFARKDEFQQLKSLMNQRLEALEKGLQNVNTDDKKTFKEKQKAKRGKLGLPFSPIARAAHSHGTINQIKVAPSVWAAALQVPLTVALEDQTDPKKWLTLILPAHVALFLSCASQVVFTYFMYYMMRDLNNDDFGGGPTCDGAASPYLKFVAVSVFLSYGLGTEIMEALATNRWLSAFPAWDEKKHTKVLEGVESRDVNKTSSKAHTAFLVFQEATNSLGGGASAIVPAVGLSNAFKIYARFVFVLVRMVIAGAIMIEASGLIFYSPNNVAVLGSAVAATFVLDIDNYVFQLLVTDKVKRSLEAIPSIGISDDIGYTAADYLWQYFGSYLLVAVLLLTAGSLQVAWCGSAIGVLGLAPWQEASLGLGIPILACTGLFAGGTCRPADRREGKADHLHYRNWPTIKNESGVEGESSPPKAGVNRNWQKRATKDEVGVEVAKVGADERV